MLDRMGSAHDTSTNKQIGNHIVRVESAEAICLVFRGVITLEDAKLLKAMMYEHAETYGSYSYIANVSALTGIDSGARHELVHVDRPYPFKHCFVVGASFGIRTLIEGVYRARRLLRPAAFHYSMEMVATEAEAVERAKKYAQTTSPR